MQVTHRLKRPQTLKSGRKHDDEAHDGLKNAVEEKARWSAAISAESSSESAFEFQKIDGSRRAMREEQRLPATHTNASGQENRSREWTRPDARRRTQARRAIRDG